ncbi:APOBEC3H isoform 3 [Pongo abelii]|uniref:APOBEC3H isoform 3 n=2 Tax=Pongo abelii TaxID=9601 RepID=A0A2J8TX73_PONAB|nr:APOBEC3H isoform 3 [Pongo abelii]
MALLTAKNIQLTATLKTRKSAMQKFALLTRSNPWDWTKRSATKSPVTSREPLPLLCPGAGCLHQGSRPSEPAHLRLPPVLPLVQAPAGGAAASVWIPGSRWRSWAPESLLTAGKTLWTHKEPLSFNPSEMLEELDKNSRAIKRRLERIKIPGVHVQGCYMDILCDAEV